MLEDEGKKIGRPIRLNDEHLLRASNGEHLLTFRNVTKAAAYAYEMVVRSPATMLTSPTSRTFVTETLSTGKGIPPLRNSYERTFKSDLSSGNWTMVVDIIPGGNPTLAGWRKDVIIHHGFNGKKTSDKSYFNAEGQLVRGPEVSSHSNGESQPGRETKEPVSMTKLMDESGNLEIVDLTPYKPEDQAVAYYGFEEYEKKVLSGNTTWNFQQEHVVWRKFAFTGKSYLELKPGQKLHGEITPQDQDDIYIFSSWIRSPGPSLWSFPGIGAKSKHLKVI